VRLNRELRMVSACTEILVRAQDETTLLDEVCCSRRSRAISPNGIDALRAHAERERALQEVCDLAGQLVHAQDDVRRLVGRELHDSTGQTLAALVMSLHRLAGAAEDSERRVLVAQCMDPAKQSAAELRTASYLLHPPLLDELGLGSALRWLATGFHDRSGIDVTLDVPEQLGRFDPDGELALFRVAQEALTNVHRHSGSPTVHLSVAVSGDSINLEIKDAGRGMQPTPASARRVHRA